MSKPRYNWWSFALAIIRDYPLRAAALKEIHEQKMTADLSGMPKGGSASRTTEGLATRQLPPQEQREYDAVYYAIKRTKTMKEAKLRMDVIKLTMWRGYTIASAAMVIHTSERTARRYRWEFTLLVGRMYGFLSEEDYCAALKKDTKKVKIGLSEPK